MNGGARRLVVLGGGITGLTVAYRVLSQRDNPYAVTLLEADGHLGGKIRTAREHGLVLDGGPDAFVAAKPEAKDLCRDLGIDDHLIETNPAHRRVYIRREGELVAMPEGVVLTIPTRVWPLMKSPLFTLKGVARMGLDLLLPRGHDDDESIGSFIERRLGREALDRLGEPILGGIYVGDPHRLSLRATFPQLAALEDEHRSLVLGTLKTRKPPRTGPPPSAFFSLRGGMGELPETLAKRVIELGAHVRQHTRAIRIAETDYGYEVTAEGPSGEPITFPADALVIALPPSKAKLLSESFDTSMASTLDEVPLVSSATCLLAYPKSAIPHPMDAVGVLIPKSEGRRALALTFVTSKWADRAPDSTAIIRCFFGGYSREEDALASDADLLGMATRDLREVVGVKADPLHTRIFRYPKGNPQPIVGHRDRMRRVREATAKHRRLYLGGGSFDGVGIPDCIRQANEIARKLIADRAP